MKKLTIILAGLFCCLNAFAQTGLWENAASRNLDVAGERTIIPLQSNLVRLNDAQFRALQQTIPDEASGRSIVMALPTPTGELRNFNVFERVTMEKGLADKYPMIKTYQAIAADDPFVTAKLDYTLFGFHAMVFSREGVYFIDPYTNSNTGYYNTYYKRDYVRQSGNYSVCETGAEDVDVHDGVTDPGNRMVLDNSSLIIADGSIRNFRLALTCTIEYSVAVAGPNPTKPAVLSAMVTSVNRVNGVYEKDLSIHMNLVANNDTLIFIGSDNFSNTNGGTLLGQNQTVTDARIGNANYDIGHIFSTGGGGVAGLAVVCRTGQKARGVTGSSNPVGDGFDIDYVAHEMGHQFGANHTFNGNTGSCSGNRVGAVAYEPGSGTTIMAYAGICGNNNIQPNSDDYFHRASINEIYSYIITTSCASITSINNTPPTVADYAATYYIPYKTSFEISASASDAEGNPVNYCWEEYDLGPAGSWDNNGIITAPIFRSFDPEYTGTRIFPRWDSLVKNIIKYRGEVLPETTRDVKFRCTVRDINNGYGAFNAPNTDLILKSVITPSLFRVTSFPTASTFSGNTLQTINWDVANTTASPISCSTVNIYLSLDSARTFPILLAGNTPNDGSQAVIIPDVVTATSSARIKVKGSNNVFFDLNDGWIKINQGAPLPSAAFIPSDTAVCAGASLTFTNTSSGSAPDSVRWILNGSTTPTSTAAASVTATYNTPGAFTATLLVYKFGVLISSAVKTITVNAYPNIIFNPTSAVICNGQSVSLGVLYTPQGATNVWSTGSTARNITVSPVSTTYYSVVVTNAGCSRSDSVLVTVKPTSSTSLTESICSGDSIVVGTQVFRQTGNYSVVLTNAQNCDSTVQLNLTVRPVSVTNLAPSICSGDSVVVGGQVFKNQGNYVVVLQNAQGCDSTINVNLSVREVSFAVVNASICAGDSVVIGNQRFDAQGSYTVVLQNTAGCDSTVQLNLTVRPVSQTSLSESICSGDSVVVGSQSFKTEGNYTVVLQNSAGCDSTVSLSLAVRAVAETNISTAICSGDSVVVGGLVFKDQGSFSVTLQNSQSCDSVINLNLTVNPLPATPAILLRNDSLVVTGSTGASYLWYLNGVFQISTSVPQYKPTLVGTWTVEVVSAADCSSDASAPFVFSSIRNKSNDIQFAVIPNPNNGQFNLVINALKSGPYQLVVYTVSGQEVMSKGITVVQGTHTESVSMGATEKGAYFIVLKGEQGITTLPFILQ
jgi:plastocyanin